jgi:hypothetical protein
VSVALLVARIALAATFVVAGAAKLADLPGARAAAVGLRVPRSLASAGVPALAGLEVLVGSGLIPAGSSPYAAAAAALGVLGLTALAASAILRGLRPECRCFGSLGAGRIGGVTLIRNAMIFAVSALVAISGWKHPGETSSGRPDGLSATTITGFVALLLLTVVTTGLTRSNARLRVQRDAAVARLGALGAAAEPADPANALEHARPGPLDTGGAPTGGGGLEIGSEAPGFRLENIAGGDISLEDILSPGNRAMLTFVHMRCGECARLIANLAAWQRRHASELTIAVVAAGKRSATVAKAIQHGLERVGHDPERAVFAAFGVARTPAAVLLDPDGMVVSPIAYGTAGISTLVAGLPGGRLAAGASATIEASAQNGHRAEARPLLPIQRPLLPAEQIVLRTVDDRALPIQQVLGPTSLAVFIRPECIFSRRLLPELRAPRPAHAPGLVIICHGDPQDMGLSELQLPVFVDTSGAAGPALGTRGTPAAVLTRSGRPAAPAVSGAAQILALARGEIPVNGDCGCGRR